VSRSLRRPLRLVYGQPFRLPLRTDLRMRPSPPSRSRPWLDPGFSLNFDARPYLLPADDRQRPIPNDFINENWAPGRPNSAKPRPRHPRRLDDTAWARIETKATFRYRSAPAKPTASSARPAIAQQVSGQSFLLGGLPIASALLPPAAAPPSRAVPLVLGVPVASPAETARGKLQAMPHRLNWQEWAA